MKIGRKFVELFLLFDYFFSLGLYIFPNKTHGKISISIRANHTLYFTSALIAMVRYSQHHLGRTVAVLLVAKMILPQKDTEGRQIMQSRHFIE